MNTDQTEQANPTPRPRWQVWLAGIVIGDVVVGLLYGLGAVLLRKVKALEILGVPSFFLMPALGGLVASYVWRELKPTLGATLLNTLWMSLLALAGAVAVFQEGAICLLIVFPLFYTSILAGALVGRVLFKVHPARLRVSILP